MKRVKERILKALEQEYRVTKKVHQGYKEFKDVGKKNPELKQLFGKWHYIYESPKGRISLIRLVNYYGDRVDWWEILSIGKDLFEDVERFKSKKSAEKRVAELLN